MKRNDITYGLLKNYIMMLLVTTLLTILLFILIVNVNTLNNPDNIYNQISANSLMKDDYKEIDTRQVVEYGGGLQVVNSDFSIVYSKGKKQFKGTSISPEIFTTFLLEATNNKDIITVAYNEKKDFWLIISMPINIKMQFGLSINTQNPMDTSTLWTLGLFLLGYLFIVLISTMIYAKRTATLFINPLQKLCLAVDDFRVGKYNTRVAIEGNREFRQLETAFNQMAQEIETQIVLKEKSEKNRKDLILDISHDLKNPLMSIVGYAELTLKEEKTNQYAKIIYENSLRVNEMVQDLFELSQLESTDFKLEYSMCDFIEYFREEIIYMLPQLENEGLKVNMQIPDIEVILRIDQKRMRRVISNLLYNIMAYHGDKKEVDIILENRDRDISIIFSNFIDKEVIHKNEIFEPFITHNEATKPYINNVGLGLSIVKKIITLHGGRVVLKESQYKRFEIEIILDK